MFRVVLMLAAIAALVGAPSGAEASRGHRVKMVRLPKVHIHTARSHGRRGQSSYGGPSWSGSSYDHHKPRHVR
jgi:hypothetical protein